MSLSHCIYPTLYSFFFTDTPTTEIYTLSLHDALPISLDVLAGDDHQIGHLIDDDDDERQRIEGQRLLLVDRLAAVRIEAGLDGARQLLALGERLGETRVVALDV